MDIQRTSQARKRRIRRVIFGSVGLVVVALVTVGLSRLKPAAPSVDKGTIWTDTVKRGEMLREVRGTGTLLPEEIRWVPIINPGRVERILVLPGAAVQADTILIELSNPELEQAVFDSEWQCKAAAAELDNLQAQLESLRLSQVAAAASLKADFSQAELEAEADEELCKDGLVPKLVMKRSRSKADELKSRYEIEEKRLQTSANAARAQVAVQQAKVEQLRAQSNLKRQQFDSLKVRAGLSGVLQKLGDREQLQVGQQLPSGANVARVADPARLKAEIKIAETQAKDVQLGQPVSVDTRNGLVEGRVVRIDPAVQNGTVTVDVTLEGALPKGSRPDLSVDGTIQLERLADVVNVGRPVQGQAESTVGLFKLVNGGREAVRVQVKLGRSSVNAIEVRGGLEVGDQIIRSDMSQWDAYDRVRIN